MSADTDTLAMLAKVVGAELCVYTDVDRLSRYLRPAPRAVADQRAVVDDARAAAAEQRTAEADR